jgi:hypothetical protein
MGVIVVAGIGPAPQAPSKRARRNKDSVAVRVVSVEPTPQPGLFESFGVTNPSTDEDWHPATLRFWDELGEFPTTAHLVGAQWTLLGVAVMLFDRVMRGKLGYAEEMRREFAAFGISPADLARLRIQFAVADEVEDKRVRPDSQQSRYAALRAVD